VATAALTLGPRYRLERLARAVRETDVEEWAGVDSESGEPVSIRAEYRWIGEGSDSLARVRAALLQREMAHPNVARVTDVRLSRPPGLADVLYTVRPRRVRDMDLHTVLQRAPQQVTADHARYFFYQLAYGLKYLHSLGLTHRLVTPNRLLVDPDCQLRLDGLDWAAGATPELDPAAPEPYHYFGLCRQVPSRAPPRHALPRQRPLTPVPPRANPAL
jgi:serine/threonine protein kinase